MSLRNRKKYNKGLAQYLRDASAGFNERIALKNPILRKGKQGEKAGVCQITQEVD